MTVFIRSGCEQTNNEVKDNGEKVVAPLIVDAAITPISEPVKNFDIPSPLQANVGQKNPIIEILTRDNRVFILCLLAGLFYPLVFYRRAPKQ